MRRTHVVLASVIVLVAGVGCTPSPPPGVLAIAFTNTDGIAGYDEATDVLIAKLVDTDEDGVASVGDTVVTHKYPINWDQVPPFGTFQVTNHTVTRVDTSESYELAVVSETPTTSGRFGWYRYSGVFEGFFEHPLGIPGGGYTSFADALTPLLGTTDVIQVDPQSPSSPTHFIPDMANHNGYGNNRFVDVIFAGF